MDTSFLFDKSKPRVLLLLSCNNGISEWDERPFIFLLPPFSRLPLLRLMTTPDLFFFFYNFSVFFPYVQRPHAVSKWTLSRSTKWDAVVVKRETVFFRFRFFFSFFLSGAWEIRQWSFSQINANFRRKTIIVIIKSIKLIWAVHQTAREAHRHYLDDEIFGEVINIRNSNGFILYIFC